MMEFFAVMVAAAVGLLLGLMYRVPALLAATAVLILSCTITGIAGQWSLSETLFWAVMLTVTMQAFYVAGVGLARLVRSRGS